MNADALKFRSSKRPDEYSVEHDGVLIGTVLKTTEIYPWARYTAWKMYTVSGMKLDGSRRTRAAAAQELLARAKERGALRPQEES